MASHFDDFKKIQFKKDEEDERFLQSLDFDETVFLYDTIRWFGYLLDDEFKADFSNAVRKKEKT